jgi:hypothetical protein
MGEKLPVKFCQAIRLHKIAGFFNMPQSCDMGQTALLPLRRKACLGFLRLKNPTACLFDAQLANSQQLQLHETHTKNC